MEDLNGPWLFDSMYTDDPEAEKLAALPGMEELLAAYPYKQAYRESYEYNQIGDLPLPFMNLSVTNNNNNNTCISRHILMFCNPIPQGYRISQ